MVGKPGRESLTLSRSTEKSPVADALGMVAGASMPEAPLLGVPVLLLRV